MEDILILKDKYFPIEGVAKKPLSMIYEYWIKLDRKVIAIIHRFLAKNVYFNVVGEKTTEGLWKNMHDLYEENSTSNKVVLIKKLYKLKMKEGASMRNK
jgi:hypothetical protein